MAQPAVATPAAAPSPLAAAAPGVLEMEARVEGNPVVFAGRTVCCRLRLANRSAAPQQLAWASAQVHCQCSVNAARIALPPQPHARGSGESYAFTPTRDARGQCVYESQPIVLLCDLQLAPGEAVEYPFTVALPRSIPPSYRGEAITYTYQVSVGAQRVGHPAQLIRVPFRVLPVTESMESACLRGSASFDQPPSPLSPSMAEDGNRRRANSTIRAGSVRSRLGHLALLGLPAELDDLDTAAERNPFLPEPSLDVMSEERLSLAIMSLTRRKRSSFFNLSTADGERFAEFTFYKRCFRLGEDVLGHFQLSNISRRCYHISVALQSREVIDETVRRPGGHEADAISFTTHALTQHPCAYNLSAAISLPIPFLATSAFRTQEVEVAWFLSFEFVVDAAGRGAGWRVERTMATESELVSGDAPHVPVDDSNGHISAANSDMVNVRALAPESVEVEVVRWTLPIDVLPADPMHIPFRRAVSKLRWGDDGTVA